MHLVADIGNSRIKLAIFNLDNEMIYCNIAIKSKATILIKKAIKQYNVSSSILSNTSDLSEASISLFRSLPHFIHLDQTTPIPIINAYDNPASLGKDRLAAAVGAHTSFPSKNVLFIDMGTCITMNLIDEKGRFLGGNISPGITMRLKAMHVFTDKLPLIQPEIPQEIIGKNTVKGMQNGAIKGAFREIDTFIEDIRKEIGEIVIILTGGDANLFENYTKNKIFVAPYLVLQGLNEILKYNVYKN